MSGQTIYLIIHFTGALVFLAYMKLRYKERWTWYETTMAFIAGSFVGALVVLSLIAEGMVKLVYAKFWD